MRRFLRDYRAALIYFATDVPIPDPWYFWDRAVSWITKRRADAP